MAEPATVELPYRYIVYRYKLLSGIKNQLLRTSFYGAIGITCSVVWYTVKWAGLYLYTSRFGAEGKPVADSRIG